MCHAAPIYAVLQKYQNLVKPTPAQIYTAPHARFTLGMKLEPYKLFLLVYQT